MTKVDLLVYLYALIGFIASTASGASLVVKKDSELGLWLAWLASAPLKHRPTKTVADTVKKIGTATLFVLLVLVTVGCAGTLEESRARATVRYIGPVDVRYVAGKATTSGVVDRDSKRCQSLADKESLAGGASVFFGVAAGASGVSAWPAKSDRVEQGLAWAAGSALILAGTARYFEGRYKSQWATECSH